jgi:hypothetical protein
MMRGKQHCRICGELFCNSCCGELSMPAAFCKGGKGNLQKACKSCIDNITYGHWKLARYAGEVHKAHLYTNRDEQLALVDEEASKKQVGTRTAFSAFFAILLFFIHVPTFLVNVVCGEFFFRCVFFKSKSTHFTQNRCFSRLRTDAVTSQRCRRRTSATISLRSAGGKRRRRTCRWVVRVIL